MRQVQRVVNVASGSRAPPLTNQVRVPKQPQMVGHKVLALTNQVDEIADTIIALSKVDNDSPADVVRQQFENCRNGC